MKMKIKLRPNKVIQLGFEDMPYIFTLIELHKRNSFFSFSSQDFHYVK